ncbi:transcription initiation factor TFIID subunit 4-like [Galleria mellonella]|uniref:Transcription initiation factor TFIID subunit 4-like n=1 Tax=Galleria mellonella TaxID=7137 RepID=A0A6J1WNP6_GALME|nr:transcription initiation factor TFIID subunit 4-like [Galleria mellonella]XP_052752233.1 transcription initiation factor TFIID subunit 4-like [Galleria mellonella]
MQRAELEEMKQHQMNLVALQAIGPRKKPCLEGLGAAGATVSNGGGHSDGDFTGRSHLAFRTRPKQINHRDMMFLMEQKRETAYSQILYRNYLK